MASTSSSASSSAAVSATTAVAITIQNIWERIPSVTDWIATYNETKVFVGFWGDKDVLSNFYRAKHPMVFSEKEFMLSKAEYFGDTATHALILKATTPKQTKDLGRLVKGFHADKVGSKEGWNVACLYYMYMACLNKFTHPANKELLFFLWRTLFPNLIFGKSGAVSPGQGPGKMLPLPLAETSAHDRIWGVGMSMKDARHRHPVGWRGTNLLGRVLMFIRDSTWVDRLRYATAAELKARGLE